MRHPTQKCVDPGAAKEAAALGALRLLRAGFERDEDVVHALRRAEAGAGVPATVRDDNCTLRHDFEPQALVSAQADNKHRPLNPIRVPEDARHIPSPSLRRRLHLTTNNHAEYHI